MRRNSNRVVPNLGRIDKMDQIHEGILGVMQQNQNNQQKMAPQPNLVPQPEVVHPQEQNDQHNVNLENQGQRREVIVGIKEFQNMTPLTFDGGIDPLKAESWTMGMEKIFTVLPYT
ncbi:hypothetical protein U1Q18_028140 [Sarracenia purpurea var. burkii]